MYTDGVTQRYKNAIMNGGFRKTVVDLYYDRQSKPVATDLKVISGSVTIDSTAATRRTATLTLAPTVFIKKDGTSVLPTAGLEIGIRTGVVYADKSSFLVPMGKFPIETVNWTESGGSCPTLTLNDRSFTIAEQSSRSGFEDYSGTSTVSAIQDLLTKSVFIDVAKFSVKQDPMTMAGTQLALIVDPAVKDVKIPSGSPISGGSFWDNIQQLATTLGCEIFFDVDGVNVILRPVPALDITSTPVYAVAAGLNLIDDTQNITRDGCYNAIFATGVLPTNAASNQLTPTCFVSDEDASSPTYYGGPYGRRVYTWDSGIVVNGGDSSQLLTATKAKLKTLLGFANAPALVLAPDPTLDAWDVMGCTFLDGTTANLMAQQIAFDLSNGSGMTVSTLALNTLV